VSLTLIPFYRRFLTEELSKRVTANPRYSLRRFSQVLDIEPGPLSQILRGLRSPSTKVVARIFSGLETNELIRKQFVNSLLEEKASLGKKRVSKRLVHSIMPSYGQETQADPLDQDYFRVIADWYNLAIWEMVERKDFNANPAWIAKRLGISPLEAKLALQRLETQRLIILKDGRYQKSNTRLQTKDLSKTSEAHRRRQKQILQISMEALSTIPIDRRHHSAITLNLDAAQIPSLREEIQKMLWQLAEKFKSGNPNQVHEISLQVFPLERPPNKEKDKAQNSNEK